MSTNTTNPMLIELVKFLKRKSNEVDAPIWDAIAENLRKHKHARITCNLGRINTHTKEGETVVVPGKILGAGRLSHKVTVAAFNFSKTSRAKIEEVGGQCLTIQELINTNPKGSGITILG